MRSVRPWGWTLHYLDDEGNRIGFLYEDDLDRGLDRLRRSSATWIDAHGPKGLRRVFVREGGPGSDWVTKREGAS